VNEPGTMKQVSFRIPADQAAALKRAAERGDRTVSGLLRRLIRQRIKEAKEEGLIR
jgi:predicted DNA-binding protein